MFQHSVVRIADILRDPWRIQVDLAPPKPLLVNRVHLAADVFGREIGVLPSVDPFLFQITVVSLHRLDIRMTRTPAEWLCGLQGFDRTSAAQTSGATPDVTDGFMHQRGSSQIIVKNARLLPMISEAFPQALSGFACRPPFRPYLVSATEGHACQH